MEKPSDNCQMVFLLVYTQTKVVLLKEPDSIIENQ
jgi:hypothetical protein